MGKIRNAVSSFDSAPEVADAQRELVETLANLAQAKADYFDLHIQDSLTKAGTSNKTVPIESVIDSVKQTHAFTSQSSTHVIENVSNTVEDFITNGRKNVLSSVTKLLSTAVGAFLGEGSATTLTFERMYVITEGLSIVRFDVKGWYQKVQSSAISSQLQKVSAFVGVKSAIDIEAVRFNTFLNLYQDQLLGSDLSDYDVKEELEAAREIYNILRSDKSNVDSSKSLILESKYL